MAFSKVNPPGWSTGQNLTAVQINQLDTDHSNALDKTVAGDTISGTVVVGAPAKIQGTGVNTIVAAIAGAISDGGITHGIAATVAGGISDGGVVGGIAPSVAGGIGDGGIAGGIKPTVAGGITSNTAGGIKSTIAGGIQAGVAGGISDGGFVRGIVTSVANGIGLGGGTTDWINYQQTRSTTRFQMPRGAFLLSNWAFSAGVSQYISLTTTATSTQRALIPMEVINGVQSGATLTSITVIIEVIGVHTSVPASLPTIDIQRTVFGVGTNATSVSLFTGGATAIANPATAAAWNAGGLYQQFTLTPNQNNIIDTSQYVYHIVLVDENGANSIAGNLYPGFLLTFSNIANSGL